MSKRLELLAKLDDIGSITGKEFKEEIHEMSEEINGQIFYAIDKKYEDEVDNLLINKDNNFFQKYNDHALLFADKESIRNLDILIKADHIKIDDDSEIKISPVTFVNKAVEQVYNSILCEDQLSSEIDNQIKAVFKDKI